eukprot:1146010-Pelagomonas_calceolata.AAC.3
MRAFRDWEDVSRSLERKKGKEELRWQWKLPTSIKEKQPYWFNLKGRMTPRHKVQTERSSEAEK